MLKWGKSFVDWKIFCTFAPTKENNNNKKTKRIMSIEKGFTTTRSITSIKNRKSYEET